MRRLRSNRIVIIGAGPAGFAAAIQLKRCGRIPLIFESQAIGGLLRNAHLVENYPGFPGGISGPDLVHLFESQADKLELEAIWEAVLSLDYTAPVFRIKTARVYYEADLAIVATGTKPKLLETGNLNESVRNRILYEVYSLADIEGHRIAIIGAGDAAFDYALNLSRKNEVLILNRSSQTRCLPLLRTRAENFGGIDYRENAALVQIMETSQNRLALECISPAGKIVFEVDELICALGREPELDFISQSLLEQCGELEDRGVFYRIGDVKNGSFRQTAIAVGDGVLAAMKIDCRLKETEE